MNLDAVCKLIRKGDVILFIGSGFSKYAGYPLGNGLASIIYDELSESQKIEIDSKLPLPDLAEEYVRCQIGNKRPLVEILHKVFLKPPNNTKFHDILASIPHFKTIITTNYDRLLEMSYKDKARLIVRDIDLTNHRKRVDIFKIHGDILQPDSIIITSEDYENYFYDKKEDSLVWSTIKSEIARRPVIFIGYSLEDPNVNVLLKKISSTLKDLSPQLFFVSPNEKLNKQNHLTTKRVAYLNLTGEAFISEVLKNIRKNLTRDFRRGWISEETFHIFMNNKGIQAETRSNGFEHQIISLQPKVLNSFSQNFSFTINDDEGSASKLVNTFLTGNFQEQFEIDVKQFANLDIEFNGVSLIDSDEELSKIILKRIPVSEGPLRIVFNDKKEFDHLYYKLYLFKNGRTIIIIQLNSANLEVELFLKPELDAEIKMRYVICDSYKSVSKAIFNYEFLLRLYSGTGFKYYIKNEKASLNPITSGFSKTIQTFIEVLKYFECLGYIEGEFNIDFDNIIESEMNYELVNNISHLCQFKEYISSFDVIATLIKNDHSIVQKIQQEIDNNKALMLIDNTLDSVVIHGNKLRLSYKFVTICDPVISLEKLSENILIISSKSDRVIVRYVTQIEDEEVGLVAIDNGTGFAAVNPKLQQLINEGDNNTIISTSQ